MSKVEPSAPLRERQEAMLRLWPDHPGFCTLRVSRPQSGRLITQCGVELVPLTVDWDYLSVRCPSCRVLSIHTRVAPLG